MMNKTEFTQKAVKKSLAGGFYAPLITGTLRNIALPVIGGVAGYKASEGQTKAQRVFATTGGAAIGGGVSLGVGGGKLLYTLGAGYKRAKKLNLITAAEADKTIKQVANKARASLVKESEKLNENALEHTLSKVIEGANSPLYWVPMIGADAGAIGGVGYLMDKHIRENRARR